MKSWQERASDGYKAMIEYARDSVSVVHDNATVESVPTTRIQASTGWLNGGLAELWAYRELAYFFIWANVKVRYKQTVLGAAWAIIQPVFAMVVFSVFFGKLAGIPTDGVPYPIFVYAGLLPWTYFANSLGTASNSVLGSRALISKVYFPRLLLPLTSVLTGLIDLFAAFGVLILLMLYYGIIPGVAILALPLFVLLAAATALAVSLWFSALGVEYRDIPYIVPFLIQIWLFATPVVYPSSLVPERWRPVYGLNPMAGVIDGFRWSLLGQGNLPLGLLAVSAGTVTLLLSGGLLYFRRMERSFVDVV
jgi:lipopolysaccharide transport system permease protein